MKFADQAFDPGAVFTDGRNEKERYTAEQFILRKCDGSDYERGSMETAQAAADNAGQVLARLVQKLFDIGALTKEDVEKIGRGY